MVDFVGNILASELPDGAGAVVVGRDSRGSVFESVLPGSDGSFGVDAINYAASLTKQFIGLLVSLLVEDELLEPATTLRSVLPALPKWAEEIQLHHLLHHTSGIVPAKTMLEVLGLPHDLTGEQRLTNESVIYALSLRELVHEPGSMYEYNNAGYVCLAEVVARVCDQSIATVAESRAFGPLGMTNSHLGLREGDAHGGSLPPATTGDGGLWTTATDLLRWNDAMNQRYFGEVVHLRAETPGTLNDGTRLDYAWGIREIRHGGAYCFSHGGSWPATSSKTLRCPSTGTSVALFASCDDTEAVTRTALRILEYARGNQSSIEG